MIDNVAVEGWFTPYTHRGMQILFTKGIVRPSFDGLEKKCNQCREWWFYDTEFFPFINRNGLYVMKQPCRGCAAYNIRISRESA